MKKTAVLLSLLFISICGRAQQHIAAMNAQDIMHRASSGDTVYIINFWATWCVPCVQELPEFNDLDKRYAGKPVKILLVSLDFKENYPDKLAFFAERKKLTPEIAWLSETDPNAFIPKIDESWEGSIPATLIIMPGRFRKFAEGQVTAGQVARIVDNLLSKE